MSKERGWYTVWAQNHLHRERVAKRVHARLMEAERQVIAEAVAYGSGAGRRFTGLSIAVDRLKAVRCLLEKLTEHR